MLDRAETRDLAGDQARECERAVVLGHEDRKLRRRLAHFDELLGKDLGIDVGRGENDVADLAVHMAVPDAHLPQRLHRQPCAHGVGKHGDFLHARVLRQNAKGLFQRGAGIVGALLVVFVVPKLGA
jgi:hypothetical protein